MTNGPVASNSTSCFEPIVVAPGAGIQAREPGTQVSVVPSTAPTTRQGTISSVVSVFAARAVADRDVLAPQRAHRREHLLGAVGTRNLRRWHVHERRATDDGDRLVRDDRAPGEFLVLRDLQVLTPVQRVRDRHPRRRRSGDAAVLAGCDVGRRVDRDVRVVFLGDDRERRVGAVAADVHGRLVGVRRDVVRVPHVRRQKERRRRHARATAAVGEHLVGDDGDVRRDVERGADARPVERRVADDRGGDAGGTVGEDARVVRGGVVQRGGVAGEKEDGDLSLREAQRWSRTARTGDSALARRGCAQTVRSGGSSPPDRPGCAPVVRCSTG